MMDLLQLCGAIMGALGFGIAVYQLGHAHGLRQGHTEADDREWDNGWDKGYESGYNTCRDKAIEFGVAGL